MPSIFSILILLKALLIRFKNRVVFRNLAFRKTNNIQN